MDPGDNVEVKSAVNYLKLILQGLTYYEVVSGMVGRCVIL